MGIRVNIFRTRIIFYFQIVFTEVFLNMASVQVRFSLGFEKEQDFPDRNLIRADNVGKNRFSEEQFAPAWFYR
jgi:hypothetical protein